MQLKHWHKNPETTAKLQFENFHILLMTPAYLQFMKQLLTDDKLNENQQHFLSASLLLDGCCLEKRRFGLACKRVSSQPNTWIVPTEYTECWPCTLFDILFNKYFPAGQPSGRQKTTVFCWATVAGNALQDTYPLEYQICSSQPRQKSCWASSLCIQPLGLSPSQNVTNFQRWAPTTTLRALTLCVRKNKYSPNCMNFGYVIGRNVCNI